MKNSNCNQIKSFINLEIIGEEKLYIYMCVCVGQFCPVFKLYGRRPGPILSSFVQMKQEMARPNIQCEGKRISEDS